MPIYHITSILLSKTIFKYFIFEGYFKDSWYEYYITVYITVKVKNGGAARNGSVRPCYYFYQELAAALS